MIELHAAGMRKSKILDYWHDAHGMPLSKDITSLIQTCLERFPNVQGITFEHSMEGPESDFISGLQDLREISS